MHRNNRRQKLEEHVSVQEVNLIHELTQDIFHHILDLTNDVRTIYRSKSVCREWYKCINENDWSAAWEKEEPWFLLQYKNKTQANGDPCCEVWRPLSGTRFAWPHTQRIPASAFHFAQDPVTIFLWQGSSEGLVLSWSAEDKKMMIWNPLTGVAKLVPGTDSYERPEIWVDSERKGCYHLAVHGESFMWIYDSETEVSNTYDTHQRYREQGVKGCLLAAAEHNQEHPNERVSPVAYLNQYLLDQREGGQRWQQSLWQHLPLKHGMVHFFEQRSRGRYGCIAVVREVSEAQGITYTAWVYELVRAEVTCTSWKLLGCTEVLKGFVGGGLARFAIRSTDDLLMVAASPYSDYSARLTPPRVFDLNNLTWACFDSAMTEDVSVLALFKPNLSAVP